MTNRCCVQTMFSRKRPLEVDANGYGPISKKLHKLQIDPTIPVIPIPTTESGLSTKNGSHGQLELAASQSLSHFNSRELLNEEFSYNPVLGVKQNPIYFEANRLLFEAHQLRVTRSSTQTPQSSDRSRSVD